MAFPHRKLLPKKPDPLGVNPLVISKPCPKICVPPCPDDCNAVPPPPPPPPPPPHAAYNNSVVLLSVLCFLGFAFLIVSYVSIIRYRSKVRNSRRRNLHVFNDSGDGFIDDGHRHVLDHPIWYIRTVGLNQSVIDSIEVFRYKKGEGLVKGSACSVCLSAFQEDENLRLLPKCSHAFHIHCVDTWLRSHKNCPLCRAPVVNDASIERVAVEDSNLDSLGFDEGNQVENVSNLAVLGSDEEGGDGGSEMRGNFIEDCTSLPVENNDVDKICDNNIMCINSLECPGGSVLSRSSTEAEYRGVAKVVSEA